jgi:membrane protein DedA with SNARE-associated domain
LVQQIWFFLHHYDKIALFGLLTVEESGIPVPVPGDIVMMYAGHRVARGEMIWWQALLCGVIATIIGSCILYNIGRRGGRPLLRRYGRYLHLTESRQFWIEGWLHRFGGFAVFAGRLIPGMRCGSSFVAGTFGVPYPSFLLGTAASAFVWWGLFLYLGAKLGRWVAPVFEEHPYTVFVFLGLIVMSSIVPVYVHFRMGQERSRAALGLGDKPI